MVADDLIDAWKREAAARFEGWDFAHLAGRMIEAQPGWDYLALAQEAVRRSHDILDIATGGGEVFSSLAPFPGRATAVEGYAPNIPVARRRLEPLGVSVLQANTASGMPFEDGAFDLVLNRHGGFRPAEMARVLKPGGVYLTQQVGGDNLADLAAAFGRRNKYPDNTLERVTEKLAAAGMEVRRGEAWSGPVQFLDVGALVFFLRAIPWVVDGFSVETDLDVLKALQSQMAAGGRLKFTYTRFLIDAVKT